MQSIQDKARRVKLLILDVDGILTTGAIYYGSNDFQMRGFHIHDGLGIKLMQKAGIPIAIISGKQSDVVKKRLQDLHVEHMYLGHEDKRPAYQDLKTRLGLEDQDIAYMGDDLPDLPLLRQAGFSATVPDAPQIITQTVDYISKKNAGLGAVRELCELILNAQQKLDSVIESYILPGKI
jgi:3-deoxy-D-manno-octulosonate 8-phosphate phosphatase (KDO 8-P phosphatase)